MLGLESNYECRNNYWYDKERDKNSALETIRKKGVKERRRTKRRGNRREKHFPLQPNVHPFPHLPSPLRILSIPLSSTHAFPSSFSPIFSSYFFPPPPLPPMSMWMALYHCARLSLSPCLSVWVQSCGRSEPCIVENACVWVYRETRLRRTMRELLELFCIVSMGACVHVCLCVLKYA